MIVIRPALHKDLPAIQRLHRQLFLLEERLFDDSVDPTWSLSKHARAWFSSQIGVRSECLLVAEVDGRVVAYLSGGLTKRLRMWKPGIYAELYNMCVNKRHRRHGLGRELMRNFLAWCDQRRVTMISVDASCTNTAAVSFYKQFGFVPLEYRLMMKRPRRRLLSDGATRVKPRR